MNAPVEFLATPGDIRIRARQDKEGGRLHKLLVIPLEVADPEKHLAVKLQDLQTHRCQVRLAIHQLVMGEGEGDAEGGESHEEASSGSDGHRTRRPRGRSKG